jgi:uncharacterized protein YvpB
MIYSPHLSGLNTVCMRRLHLTHLLSLLIITLSAVSCNTAQANSALPTQTASAAVAAAAAAAATKPPPRPSATAPPPTPSAAPTVTKAATPANPAPSTTPDLPGEHYIQKISGHKQYFPLGCEAATAKDWANFFGYDFNEFEFQYRLPYSDNPDYGFVGDVNSPWGQVPPYGYGVHAGPVADLLNQYGIPAKAYKGYTLEQIVSKLAEDKPVIAWVIGNVVGGVPYEYTDKAGRKVTVAAYEHVVIVTGYNETKLRYMTNGKFFETPKEVFLNSWGVLGNMVVVDE